MAVTQVCKIDDCGKPHKARGWCNSHWQRWRMHGDPLAGGTAKGELKRFFNEVVLTWASDECLRWPYSTKESGYAMMGKNGRPYLVSRLACETVYGPPPTPRHEAAHSCGKGHESCVNPRHLRWATSKENKADKLAHGTSNRGERCGSAKLTAADVLEIRSLPNAPRRELAARFGVGIGTISDIRDRTHWDWLD